MNILLLNSYPALDRKMVNTGRCQIRQRPGLDLWPPVDLAQLASLLRPFAGKLELIDFFEGLQSEQEALNFIARKDPDVIFVHSSTPTIKGELFFYQRLKQLLPKVKIVFFGLHVTVRPEDVLGSAIEYVIRGEPEYTARALMQMLQEGNSSFHQIEGISYYREGRIFHNPSRPFIDDLDKLPFPDRSLLKNNLYCLAHTGEPFSIVQVSRGCPFKCTFCTAGLYYGRSCRQRSIENIIAEIEEVMVNYGIKNYLFLSDTFNVNKDFVRSLSEEIMRKQLAIKWMCNSKVDLISQESMRLMKKAGCWLISLGIESAAPQVLEQTGKSFSMQQVEEVISEAQKIGLKTFCYFIFGLPGETRASIRTTLKFIMKCRSDYAYFYAATPFPGTELFEQAQRNGWLTSYDWDRYSHGDSDVISYPWLSNSQIKKAVRSGYRLFYLNPQRIKREIFSVRSRQQLKETLKIGWRLIRQ